MAKKKEGGISIANILSIIALALIGVITFFGAYFHSPDGRPAKAILTALFVVIVLGLLLFFMIKAKTVSENPDKWRYVEWGTFVAYIVLALFLAPPFQTFFYVQSQKEELKAQAHTEIEDINKLYETFHKQSQDAMDLAEQGLLNYNSSGLRGTETELDKFMNRKTLDIGVWRTDNNRYLELGKIDNLKQIQDEIDNWNIMKISEVALQLKEAEEEAWSKVEGRIKENRDMYELIPVIKGGSGDSLSRYYLDGFYEYDIPAQTQAQFTTMLRETNGNTVIGWVVYVFLNFLVLLNFFVVRRTNVVGPRVTGKPSGGLDL